MNHFSSHTSTTLRDDEGEKHIHKFIKALGPWRFINDVYYSVCGFFKMTVRSFTLDSNGANAANIDIRDVRYDQNIRIFIYEDYLQSTYDFIKGQTLMTSQKNVLSLDEFWDATRE